MAGKKTKEKKVERLFEIGTESYPMNDTDPTYFIMKVAKATTAANREVPHPTKADMGDCTCGRCVKVRDNRDKAGYELLTIMHDCMFAMVQDEYHADLDDYLRSGKLGPNVLNEAIGNAIAGMGGPESEDEEGNESEE